MPELATTAPNSEPARATNALSAAPSPAPFARGLLAASGIAAAVLLAFFLPALWADRQFGYFDNGRMHLPMKQYLAEEFRAGRLPEWNPYSGLGGPLIGAGVDAVLHPFNLLFLALPFDLAFKLWLLLLYPTAAAGAFAWARRLGAGFGAAVTAGLTFALSGYAVSLSGNMQYLAALALFPWVLAAADAFVERPSPGRGLLVAVASGTCAASGDPQGWAVALALVPVIALLAPPAVGRARGLLRSAGAIVLSVAGAAPSLFPVLRWIPYSGRAEAFDGYEYEMFNLLPARALELFVPHLFRTTGRHLASELYEAASGNALSPFPWALSEYVGITVVALALLAAVRRPGARALVGAALLFAWMAMGPNAGFGSIARSLPVLSNLRYWEKLAIWPALFLAVAAALGIDVLRRSRADARTLGRALTLLGATALFVALALAAFPSSARLPSFFLATPGVMTAAAANLRDGLLHAGVFAAALGVAAQLFARGRLSRPALVIATLCVLDVAAANVRAYVLYDVRTNCPGSDVALQLASREGLQRVVTPFGMFLDARRYDVDMETAWRAGASALYASWNVPWHVANFENYSGMRPVRFNRLWRRMGRRNHLPDLGLWGVQWVWVPPDAATAAATFLPSDRVAVPVNGPGELFRLRARPRFYLAGALEHVDRRAAMDFVLLAEHASSDASVTEGRVPSDYRPPTGTTRLMVDRPERLEIRTESDGRALLVVNDEYTTGWRATVDGKPAEIDPVNYLARGVWVDAGTHDVQLTYRTPGLVAGVATASLAAAFLCAWAIVRRRRTRSELHAH